MRIGYHLNNMIFEEKKTHGKTICFSLFFAFGSRFHRAVNLMITDRSKSSEHRFTFVCQSDLLDDQVAAYSITCGFFHFFLLHFVSCLPFIALTLARCLSVGLYFRFYMLPISRFVGFRRRRRFRCLSVRSPILVHTLSLSRIYSHSSLTSPFIFSVLFSFY